MKVCDKSAYIDSKQKQWAMIDALLGGTEKMREANTTLLPKWAKEEGDTYEARLNTATLYPAFDRTVSVMVGKPFSKELQLEDNVPPRVKDLCDDVDLEGRSMHVFATEVFKECLSYGLCGVMADFPVTMNREGAPPRTLAEEQAIGARPYATFIRHNQLLGWRTKKGPKGTTILSMLRVMEWVEEDVGEFGTMKVEQVRVYEPGKFTVYREVIKDGKATGVWEIKPELSGVTTLDYIPFVPFYGVRKGYMQGDPPLINLAYLNVKHWQSQSDQDTILHVARVPMLVIIGADENSEVNIGASTASKVPIEGDIKYVEHTGNSIKAGQESLDKLEGQMIQTGAELLISKPGQRTATEANNDAEGNKSDLQRLVEGFEDSLDQLLQFLAQWIKIDEGGHAQLFKDFSSWTLSDATAAIIKELQQAGLITKKTALLELQRRGILSPDLDPEAELEAVEEEGPALGSIPPGTELDPLTGLPVVKQPVDKEPVE